MNKILRKSMGKKLLRIIILTCLILLLPMQQETEAQTQKKSSERTAVLPQNKSDDIACYLIVRPKENINVNFKFLTEKQLQNDVSMKYDLILPEEFTDYFKKLNSGIRISVNLNTLLKDEKEGENTETMDYLIQMETGKPVLICEADGTKQELKKINHYYKAELNYRAGLTVHQGKTIEKLGVNIYIEVLNSEYDKTIYFDNMKVLSGDRQLVDYDFNQRFGKRGVENMEAGLGYESGAGTNQLLWGQLKKVGKEEKANVIRTAVVFDGTSNEANSKKYMKDYLQYELHNKGNDWRNFTSLTIAFSDEFTLPKEVTLGGDIILPKAAVKGFLKDNAHIDIGMSLVCDDSEEDSPTANAYIMKDGKEKIIVCQDGGKIYRIGSSSKNDNVIIKEYKDCYLIRLKGAVKCNVAKPKKVWIKSKISAELCKFNGYFYFDNLYVSDGKKDIIRYNVDTDIYPEQLSELYSPGTNGFYNFIFDKTLGFYHVGFDTIQLP